MLVQTYFPQRLSPSRYDTFLASGWFRGSVMLYKMDLLCLEQDIRTVVNIRLDLSKFQARKSHRKIVRKVEERFTFTYGVATTSREKEILYARHKSRFKGFIHPTLNDYLNSGLQHNVFDTKEVCVYDGDRLIAVSFFDLGERSMASLLGLFDDTYHSYSLGIYTMLKEVDYGVKHGYRWYYPGYVLDEESKFDYKLRLGEFEYYNARQRWGKFENFDATETKGYVLKSQVEEISNLLAAESVPHQKVLYPLFSMGYVGYWNAEFVRYPLFISVELSNQNTLLFAYDLDMDAFIVNHVVETPEYDHLINMEASGDFKHSNAYMMHLLMVSEHILVVPSSDFRMLNTFISEVKRKWFKNR